MAWGKMKQRAYEYDFIRCIAIIMVLGVHCTPPSTGTISAQVYNSFMYALLFTCNALFFMMSGFFNIRENYNLPTYYYKKVRNILLPTLVYMFVYEAWYRLKYGSSGHSFVAQYVMDVFSTYQNGVFWFVMSLFGMLLLAPIVAPAFRSMKRDRYRAYIVLTLSFLGLALIGSITGYPSGWSYPFGVGFALFCFGAAFDIEGAKEHYHLYLLLASLCTAVSTYLNYIGIAHANDNSPFYAVASVSVYVLLYKLGGEAKPRKLVSMIAKYSFGIYMCHIPVLQTVQPLMPSLVRPAAQAILLILVLIITLPAVVLVDKVFVRLLQKAADMLYKRMPFSKKQQKMSPSGE